MDESEKGKQKETHDCDSTAESLEILAKIISVTSISGLLVEIILCYCPDGKHHNVRFFCMG
jgi:hypothetical protein